MQELCERIELEMQALLIRACSYIYRSRNLGTWQPWSFFSHIVAVVFILKVSRSVSLTLLPSLKWLI